MDKKWLNFAGLLHNCIYNREHANCPYKELRNLDQVEKLEKLLTIKNSEAKQIQTQCNSLKNHCHQKVTFSLENLALLNQKGSKSVLSV